MGNRCERKYTGSLITIRIMETSTITLTKSFKVPRTSPKKPQLVRDIRNSRELAIKNIINNKNNIGNNKRKKKKKKKKKNRFVYDHNKSSAKSARQQT